MGCGRGLHLAHYPQEVSSPDALKVALRIPSAKQLTCEPYQFGSILQASHSAISIKICSYAHMLGTHHLHYMMQMVQVIQDSGLAFLTE